MERSKYGSRISSPLWEKKVHHLANFPFHHYHHLHQNSLWIFNWKMSKSWVLPVPKVQGKKKSESESGSVVSDSLWPHGYTVLEFSRPEYWSGEPFPSPGDLPNPGIKPRSPTLQADSWEEEKTQTISDKEYRISWGYGPWVWPYLELKLGLDRGSRQRGGGAKGGHSRLGGGVPAHSVLRAATWWGSGVAGQPLALHRESWWAPRGALQLLCL